LIVLDKVTVSYRGTAYEIGRGRDYFGIWTVGGPRSQPVEWWPETQEGWSAAWARFAVLEAPDAITPVGQNAAPSGGHADGLGFVPAIGTGGRAAVAAGLLGVGVILSVLSLFPAYLSGTSLAAQPENLVAHVIYLAGWAAGAALIALGGTRLRMGALLATGLSIVTFGLFFTDAGTAIAGGASAGAGLVMGLVGWLACAAGSAVAFAIRPAAGAAAAPAGPADGTAAVPGDDTGTVPASAVGRGTAVPAHAPGRLITLGRPRGSALGPAVLLVLAGLGAAAAFAPAWDSFTLRTSAGQTQTITAGNAFAEPGLIIAGNVIVMVAVAAVVIAAALWRPVRHGAMLLAGAALPVTAQAISALVQAGQTTSPTQFGITPAQASQLGLTISNGLTPAFWIYCLFVAILLVSFAWMLFSPHEGAASMASAGLGSGPLGSAGAPVDADTQVPTWHVAQAGAYNPASGSSPASGRPPLADGASWDVSVEPDDSDEFDSDEWDSYEQFDSDDPSDDTVTGNSGDRPAASSGDRPAENSGDHPAV
jgi:hypothetical protein